MANADSVRLEKIGKEAAILINPSIIAEFVDYFVGGLNEDEIEIIAKAFQEKLNELQGNT